MRGDDCYEMMGRDGKMGACMHCDNGVSGFEGEAVLHSYAWIRSGILRWRGPFWTFVAR